MLVVANGEIDLSSAPTLLTPLDSALRRAAAIQQAKADHDVVEQETELRTNTQITREIHALTSELPRLLPTTP